MDSDAIAGELLSIDPMKMPMLTVNVDYVELVERIGEERAFEVLGKLKDLLA